jgi:hypothetical protein
MGAHINAAGEFQSDKYPTCPAGKVPLSTKDPTAQDLLAIYAQRRRAVDAEFADDLLAALRAKGYDPVPLLDKHIHRAADFLNSNRRADGFALADEFERVALEALAEEYDRVTRAARANALLAVSPEHTQRAAAFVVGHRRNFDTSEAMDDLAAEFERIDRAARATVVRWLREKGHDGDYYADEYSNTHALPVCQHTWEPMRESWNADYEFCTACLISRRAGDPVR